MSEDASEANQEGLGQSVAELEARLATFRADLLAVRERERAAEQRTKEQAQANAILRRSVERTASERDLDRLLGHLVSEAVEAAGGAGGALFLHKGDTAFEPVAVVDGGAIVPPEHWRWDPLFRDFVESSGRDADGSFAALLSRGVGDPAPVNAATLWPEAVARHRARGHRMVWNEPLVLGGEVVGYLELARTDERPPEPEVVEVVRAVVGQMAVAVQLARLADEAREAAILRERKRAAEHRAVELAKANDALARATARLAAASDLDDVLGVVLAEAREQAGACSNALFLYDPASHTFTMRHYVVEEGALDVATDPKLAIWRDPVPADLTDVWERIRNNFRVVDLLDADGSNLWPFSVAWHRAMGHATVVLIPVLAGDRLFGFMGLGFRDRIEARPESVELARALANQAALALELARLAGEVQENEARLTLAHDAAEIGTWDWDLETDEVTWSSMNFRIWGIEPSDKLRGVLPAETVLTAIHPYDEARVRAELASAVSEGAPFRSEFRLRGSDGAERWICGLGCHAPRSGKAGRMIGVNLDVTARRTAEQAREETAIAKERSRLAGEIHDTLAQDFVGVIAHLEGARRALLMGQSEDGTSAALAGVEQALATARAGLAEARRGIWALAPRPLLDGVGLLDGLRGLVGRLPLDVDPARVCVRETGTRFALSSEAEGELLCIAREALANALRHAGQGARVAIALDYQDDALTLQVEDDGTGFSPEGLPAAPDGHYGLWTMRERAARIGGALDLQSRLGQGTRVKVRVARPSFDGDAR